MATARLDTTGWRRLAALALAAAALGIAAAGCGDDDELPDDIAGVCEVVAERFAELQRTPPRSYPEAEERIEALLEIASRGDRALAGLTDEAPDPEAYARWLERRKQVAAKLERALEAIRDEDPGAYDEARAAANEGAGERRRLAEAAGLDACAASAGIWAGNWI